MSLFVAAMILMTGGVAVAQQTAPAASAPQAAAPADAQSMAKMAAVRIR